MVRRPAVAGAFYPAQADEVERQLNDLWPPEGLPPLAAKAVVCPHAGWIYSGRVTARTVARAIVPKTVVLIGPNHRGLGRPAAIMSQGSWLMPGGQVPLASEFGTLLMKHCDFLEEDARAHALEHSLEVQVPFFTRANPDLALCPIVLARSDFRACQGLGLALAKAIQEYGRPVLLAASTDMTHYETVESARLKDRQALDRILDLDPEGLYNVVAGQGITMCGVVPTVTVLLAALELGAGQAELIQYTTSGEFNRDFSQVVGYAGLVIH